MKIPPESLVLGAPAKVVRPLTKKERAKLKWWAQKYVDNGAYCLKHGINVGGPMFAGKNLSKGIPLSPGPVDKSEWGKMKM